MDLALARFGVAIAATAFLAVALLGFGLGFLEGVIALVAVRFFVFFFGLQQIGGVEKGTLLQPDINEGGLFKIAPVSSNSKQ